jgi:hypothetical protein
MHQYPATASEIRTQQVFRTFFLSEMLEYFNLFTFHQENFSTLHPSFQRVIGGVAAAALTVLDSSHQPAPTHPCAGASASGQTAPSG